MHEFFKDPDNALIYCIHINKDITDPSTIKRLVLIYKEVLSKAGPEVEVDLPS